MTTAVLRRYVCIMIFLTSILAGGFADAARPSDQEVFFVIEALRLYLGAIAKAENGVETFYAMQNTSVGWQKEIFFSDSIHVKPSQATVLITKRVIYRNAGTVQLRMEASILLHLDKVHSADGSVVIHGTVRGTDEGPNVTYGGRDRKVLLEEFKRGRDTSSTPVFDLAYLIARVFEEKTGR